MKPKSISKLKKEVWTLFSKYIRNKYADFRGNAACVTCDKTYPIKLLQAGHFIPGRMNSILFDERGVFPQCYNCNINLKGNPRKYDHFMERTYGREVIADLDRLSVQPKHFTVEELESLKERYKLSTQGLDYQYRKCYHLIMKKPLLIRLEKYQYDWIVKASKKKDLSFSGFIRWMIEKAIIKEK